MTRPTGYGPDEARGDLRWLVTVKALRSWSEQDDVGSEPTFLAVTIAGLTVALSVADVRIFRVGCLTGYRLPRASEVLG